MSKNKYCSKCGNQLSTVAVFCSECGFSESQSTAPLTEPKTEGIVCLVCGSNNPVSSTVCQNCGNYILGIEKQKESFSDFFKTRRIFSYIVNFPLKEAWERNLAFWNSGYGKIEAISDNVVQVKTGFNLSLLYSSYGERYTIILMQNVNNPNITIVQIEIKLRFGFGFQWKRASDILKNWALFLGTGPVEFGLTTTQMIIYSLLIIFLPLVLFFFLVFILPWILW